MGLLANHMQSISRQSVPSLIPPRHVGVTLLRFLSSQMRTRDTGEGEGQQVVGRGPGGLAREEAGGMG